MTIGFSMKTRKTLPDLQKQPEEAADATAEHRSPRRLCVALLPVKPAYNERASAPDPDRSLRKRRFVFESASVALVPSRQDRLGTNVGDAPKKGGCYLAGAGRASISYQKWTKSNKRRCFIPHGELHEHEDVVTCRSKPRPAAERNASCLQLSFRLSRACLGKPSF
eukprot:COSAG06_NODE_5317_length_3567_cov_2.205882_3_plen_166_part_00